MQPKRLLPASLVRRRLTTRKQIPGFTRVFWTLKEKSFWGSCFPPTMLDLMIRAVPSKRFTGLHVPSPATA
jgi:hypothetical protein